MSLTQLRVQLTRVMASHTREQPTCGDSCERRRVLPLSLRDRVVRSVGNHLKPEMAARDQAVARWRDVGWEAVDGLPLARCANHPQRSFERRHSQLISWMGGHRDFRDTFDQNCNGLAHSAQYYRPGLNSKGQTARHDEARVGTCIAPRSLDQVRLIVASIERLGDWFSRSHRNG